MRFALLFFLYFLQSSLFAHPLHLSLTNIDFDYSTNHHQVSFRFFSDDFHLVLSHKYSQTFELADTGKVFKESSIAYILQNFQISDNNALKIDLQFWELTIANEMVWITFNFTTTKKAEELNLFNILLLDLYPDQENFVIIANKKDETGLKFDITNQQQRLIIKQ